jgi:tRNA-uridine aminocarboxypropyltransferase
MIRYSMLNKCYKCFRPVKTCYCNDIESFDPGIKFVLLMHPKEAYKQKTGTGRLTNLTLIDSEIIIDATFDDNKKTQELIKNSFYYPMVLYPGDEAHYTKTFNFDSKLRNRKLLIFIIDATWISAHKMMSRSPSLQELPKLSFSKEYRSIFEIKRQPSDFCLSTIESSYYLIKELQEAGVCEKKIDPVSLITIFKKMIKLQQGFIEKKQTL